LGGNKIDVRSTSLHFEENLWEKVIMGYQERKKEIKRKNNA
jgi:hypothetical protein